MAKKKSKDPNNKNPNPNSDDTSGVSDSSNVLTKLFGETLESEASNSLFSSDNPFRRKPIDDAPQNPPIQQNPNNGDVENPSEADQNKRKRNKEKKRDRLDDNSAGKPLRNDVKLDAGQNPNIEKVDGSGSNLDLDEKNEEGKKKKKRKRDELEREYEAKKYGVVPDDEEERREKVGAGKKRKAVDNPAEIMVSQEGYDDESKLLRTVFVGNLPLKVKKKALLKEFSNFGEIESVRIRSVPTLDSKKPKKVQIFNGKLNEAADSVHAYIVFKTEQSAEASLAHNMSVVGGNHIRVDRACPPRKKLKGDDASTPLYNNKRTVFVGNLPFDVKDEELYRLFCGIKQLESSVEAVRVIRDPGTSLGKGIAYVLFKTREAANHVCKSHNLKLRDRELRVCHAKSNPQSTPTPSKRKNPFPGDSVTSPSKKFTPGTFKRSEGRYKLNTQGDTSYQGTRASKSGEKKRTPSLRPMGGFKSRPKAGEKVKQRTEKRPSVAARKAKANGLNTGGGGFSKQGGNKRKMDSSTPQNSNRKKKPRN